MTGWARSMALARGAAWLTGALLLGVAGLAGVAAAGPDAGGTVRCEIEVPLPLDTDLFATPADPVPAGPHFILRDVTPDSGLSPSANPDGLAIRDVTLPLPLPEPSCPSRALVLYTASQGPLGAKGIAAEGTIVYDDGTVQPLKWMVGEQAWPSWAGATGRGAAAVRIGVNVGGDTITASRMDVPLVPPHPGALPSSLHLKARGGLDLVLLRAVLSNTPPDTGPVTRWDTSTLTPFGWSGWFTRSLLPPLPAEPGPIRVDDATHHLVFADSRPARFWGVNLVGNAALPAPGDAEPLATHLASLGFNLARLHHIDTDQMLANPTRGAPGQPTSLTNPEALDRLDRFSAALGAAGIFQYVEIVTQHRFRVSDGVTNPTDVPAGHKWVTTFEDDWERAEQEWAIAVWGRTNPYTGLRYADDPHVAVVELENEDSLVVAWAGGALERLPAPHTQELDAQWNAWLAKKYTSDARIAAAWTGSTHPGLGPTELLAAGSIRRDPTQRARTDQWPLQRSVDLVQFYSELELRHVDRMSRFVRDRLGFRGPLVCDTAFGIPQADVLLAACDVVDLHLYWDGAAETNVFADTSMLRDPFVGRFLERFGSCQHDKPCTLSEVQHSFPNRHAQEAPLLWAALAARQGIDAVTWFAWSHDTARRAPDGPVGALDLEGRWGALVQMPGAAWLFRSGAIPEARATFERWWSEDGLRRDLAEQPGLWLSELVDPSSVVRQRLRSSFAATGAVPGPTVSEPPGGVRWSPSASGAPLLVDRPGFSAVVGGSGRAGGLQVDVVGGAADPVVSLQEGPLGAGEPGARARLVVAGPTIRAGTLFREDGYGTVVSGLGPAGFGPVRVRVTFPWPRRPVLAPMPGTTSAPVFGRAREPGSWTALVGSAGWWEVR